MTSWSRLEVKQRKRGGSVDGTDLTDSAIFAEGGGVELRVGME